MLDALRFVRGAVAEKDFVPELTHFRIVKGHVMGFNGRMALCHPIDTDIEAAPRAATFARAIASCGDVASMHVTKAGRLAVRSDPFRAYVECIEDVGHAVYPQGETFACPPTFLDVLARTAPFMGQDASRPWSMGVHLSGNRALVTNNVVAVEHWFPTDLPAATVPHFAVREMLRIGDQPTALQSDGNSLTAWYGPGKWMRTQLVEGDWPVETFGRILDDADLSACAEVPATLWTAVGTARGFLDKKSRAVHLAGGAVRTSLAEEDGVCVDVPGLDPDTSATYHADVLALVGTAATHAAFHLRPAPFYGGDVRGVLLPMRAAGGEA